MTNTISVKAHARRKPEKAPDPFQKDIDAAREARLSQTMRQNEAMAWVNRWRDKNNYAGFVSFFWKFGRRI